MSITDAILKSTHENSSAYVPSFFRTSTEPVTNTNVFSLQNTSETNFLNKNSSMGLVMWIIIISIICFLFFSIYVYLKNNKYIEHDFDNFKFDLSEFYEKVMSLFNYSKTNVHKIIDGDGGINESSSQTSLKSQNIQQQQEEHNEQKYEYPDVTSNKISKNELDYEANESASSVHLSGKNKSGWCYIGEEKGFRSCAKVGVNDECMSGNIFPTKDICINPNLRL